MECDLFAKIIDDFPKVSIVQNSSAPVCETIPTKRANFESFVIICVVFSEFLLQNHYEILH